MFKKTKYFKLYSTIFSLMLSVVLVVIVCLAFGTISYGWFGKNNVVSGSSINISADFDDTIATYYVYKYDSVSESGSKYTINEENTAVLNSIDDLTMNSYDTIFIHRNELNHVIIRIQITGTKVTETGTITVSLDRDSLIENTNFTSLVHSETVGNTEKQFAYITSCVYFKYAAISSLNSYLLPNEDEDGLWRAAITAFNSIENETMFTTKESEETVDEVTTRTYRKVDKLEFDINYNSSNWIDTDSDGVNDTLNIYLYMNYDIDFVNYAYSDSGISTSGSISQISLDLRNDFISIKSKHS